MSSSRGCREMKTYKFKLYQHKRNRHLKRQINLAGIIYNHCIALHRRYYRLYGKTLNVYQLMKHITKLKRLPKYSHWNSLGSQAIQDIAQRIARGYTLFFRNRERGIKASPPSFKKVKWSFPCDFSRRKLRDECFAFIKGTSSSL